MIKLNAKKSYYIHHSSFLDDNVKIGYGTKIWHFCHLSKNSRIGTNCILGQNVFIGENVIIGNGVKIQNNVSVYSGVVIKNNAFIGPSVVFTNIKEPRANIENKQYVKTLIQEGSTIGANSTIMCGISIGKNSFIGAGSLVLKSIPDNKVAYGSPAKIIKKYLNVQPLGAPKEI